MLTPAPSRSDKLAVRRRAPYAASQFLFLALLVTGRATGATPHFPPTYVSIVIDDLGNSGPAGVKAVRLPGPVACAILPYTPYAAELAGMARRRGKEVLLHLPMEPISGLDPGPGALDTAMSQNILELTLAGDLASVPYASGVNNHMGSLLTSRAIPMDWLMDALHRRGGLFFLDSRTTAQTVAAHTAGIYHVPHLSRDVFLDDVATTGAIEQQFALLIRIARKRGYAVAIGHPRPATLKVLQALLPQLAFYRVRLVPLSMLLALRRPATAYWPLPLIRPPQAVRIPPTPLPKQDTPSSGWPGIETAPGHGNP